MLTALEAVLVAKHVPEKQRLAVMSAVADNLAQRLQAGQMLNVKASRRPRHHSGRLPYPRLRRKRSKAISGRCPVADGLRVFVACVFRAKSAAHCDSIQPPIPIERGHSFRLKLAANSDSYWTAEASSFSTNWVESTRKQLPIAKVRGQRRRATAQRLLPVTPRHPMATARRLLDHWKRST